MSVRKSWKIATPSTSSSRSEYVALTFSQTRYGLRMGSVALSRIGRARVVSRYDRRSRFTVSAGGSRRTLAETVSPTDVST
jgi:hypothetical protein